MNSGTAARRHGGTGWFSRATVPLCLCAFLLSCTDPRSRPAPPIIDASVAPSFELTSPGIILGSIYMFDSDGLDALDLSVTVFGGSYTADSIILLSGDEELTRPIHWELPDGLPIGTPVTVAARVRDFAGFTTSDTLVLTVQDTVFSTLRKGLNRLN